VFPPMRGGIFYEHGHRLLASGVGTLTLFYLLAVWRRGVGQRLYAALGLSLVVVQALLGGLTVMMRLPPEVSIAHLGTSMLYFAWTLGANLMVQPMQPSPLRAVPRRLLYVASAGVYLQVLLGAVVRHRGASMRCGYDAVLCLGRALPGDGLQWLQTSHRLLALLVAGLVLVATLPVIKQARSQGRRGLRQLGIAAHALVCSQVLMGVLVIKTGVNLHVVTTHLALGALLWGCMVLLSLSCGAPSVARRDRRAAATEHAALGAQPHEPSGAC
ncbi:MAG: hypothetical protein EOO40_11945, partial [Deltaproteobacteria bacterium]